MFGPNTRDEGEVFADLERLCATPGFIHAIALFCARDNFIRYGDRLKPEDLHSLYGESRLVRTEISTLIGLLARHPIEEILPTPDELQAMMDRAETLLHELHQALTKPWLEGFDPKNMGAFNPFSTAAGLREPIFYGGESAHGFQYRDFAVPKYENDNDWLRGAKGFRIEEAKVVAATVGTLLNERQATTEQSLRDLPVDQWTVLPGSTFTSSEIAASAGMDEAVVDSVLSAFSMAEGDRNASFSALNEFNATNAAPILRTADGSFVLLQHYSFLEAIYEAPFFWMAADKAYAPKALSHRGAFTEVFVADRLEQVFGRQHVHRNVIVQRADGSTYGEIDVLVLFGDIAVVVQAKSKRLTIEARKGNDQQLKDDFKKAIQDASDQAFSCAEALVAGGLTLVAADGRVIQPAEQLRTIFPLCLVSDHYPALAFQARHFLSSKPTDVIRTPLVTDIFALDVMAEMLSSPLHFLHYLNMRAMFGDRLMATHEMTLLSFHLKYNLWFDDEYNFMSLGDDFSADLDMAMLVRREGLPGDATPDGILTKLQGTAVARLIEEIERQANPGTTQLGLWLLQLNENTLRSLSAGLERIVAEAQRDGRNHDFSVLAGEPPSGLTVHCGYRNDDEAHDRLLAHCSLRKHSQKATIWFGLLLDPATGRPRFGLAADFAWEPNTQMDELVGKMPGGRPAWELTDPSLRRKTRRNERCPCGSGKKFKKCCL